MKIQIHIKRLKEAQEALKSLKSKYLLLIGVLLLYGCSSLNSFKYNSTDGPLEICYDGVVYLLYFTSGVSAKFNQDGTIVTCDAQKQGALR